MTVAGWKPWLRLSVWAIVCGWGSVGLAQVVAPRGNPPGNDPAITGQQSASDESSSAPGVRSAAAASVGNTNAAGGGAMADFSTLMTLIQQTIDPDSWLAAGGTSTLLPYPSGVFVDPSGHLRRVSPAVNTAAIALPRLDPVDQPWRVDSNLRTVSLKGLDQALTRCARTGERPDEDLLQLASLAQIRYVRIDPQQRDVWLAGPSTAASPAFLLEDLALVVARIREDTSSMGCTIEPSHAGILAAQDMLNQPRALQRLSRNPGPFVALMQDTMGPHEIRVFGLPADCSTAIALVDADEHMKQVGFGQSKPRLPIDSYFDHLDRLTDVPEVSLIRWWFSYSDYPVKTAVDQMLFELPEQCVAVLSEQQWANQQGRSPTGKQDLAAEAFATGMSAELADLRLMHPSYARMIGVFEAALALQLAQQAADQGDWSSWFPGLYALGHASGMPLSAPKTVDGLSTWHTLSDGTVVAVVSGGVDINVRDKASQQAWQKSKFLSGSLLSASSAEQAEAWWW